MLCSIVKVRLLYGASKSQVREETRLKLHLFFNGFTPLPFDDSAAAAYGGMRAELERRGTPIGPNDLMIAAIALANRATLVTHNIREFERIAGLVLLDWE